MKAFIFIVLLLFLSYVAFRALRSARRRRLLAQLTPVSWQAVLAEYVPIYQRLPDSLKEELCSHMNVFLAEKSFTGCAGLEVTEEMRIIIAAHACILLLNRKANYYPDFTSIYVYPSTYFAKHESFDGVVKTVSSHTRLGESWHRGPLVLSWDSVVNGARDIKDGHNVVLHEFAHKLDGEDGVLDGTPSLQQRSQYVSWARVMQKEFRQLKRQVKQGSGTDLDEYGATNPAEFFAVLSETFFEKPKRLKEKHPDLYKELTGFYRVDPAEW